MTVDLLSIAIAYRAAGLDIICDHPTAKYPLGVEGWQKHIFTDDEMKDYLGRRGWGIGIRNQEGLDFDNKGHPPADELFFDWCQSVHSLAPGLVDRLLVETSPSGGYHVMWKCDVIEASQKLATRPAGEGETGPQTLIETRGLGGQFMVAPSPGYQVIQGDWLKLPKISPDARALLLDCARSFDRLPKKEKIFSTNGAGGDRAGDRYNAECSDEAYEMLLDAGWTAFQRGDGSKYLRRPGKNDGFSATWNYVDENKLFVFSSNAAPFELNTSYDPFAIYTTIKHDGDFKEAAKTLWAERFGEAAQKKEAGRSASPPTDRPDISFAEVGISLDQLMTTDYPDPIWIIPKLLPAGLAILAGKPKVGKSWFVLQKVGAIARGQSFFGFDPPLEIPKIAVFALEDRPRRLQDRINKQGWYRPALKVDFFTLRDYKEIAGDLRNVLNRDTLMMFLKHHGYGLAIIDTLSRACFADQLRNEVMAEILDPFQSFALEENICVEFIDHHSSKNRGSGLGPLGDIMGATQKGGVADALFGLYRIEGTEGKLATTGREIDEVELSTRFIRETGTWIFQGDFHDHKETKAQQRYLDALDDEGKMTLKDLAEYLDVSHEAARKAVKKLESHNKVTKSIRDNDDKVVYGVCPT